MTAQEYTKQAKETAQFPENQAFQYLTLKLCGEIGELKDEADSSNLTRDNNQPYLPDGKQRVLKEIGDVCWYLHMLCDRHKIDLDQYTLTSNERRHYTSDTVSGANLAIDRMITSALNISEITGKHARGDGYSDRQFSERVCGHLFNIYENIHKFIHYAGCGDLDYVLQRNIEKLSDRANRGVIKGSGNNR